MSERMAAAGLIIMTVAACGGSGTEPTVETGTVAGSVVDVDSGSAGLAGVVVRLNGGGQSRTATSVTGGAFSLSSVPVGSWQAEVEVPGTHRLESGEAGSRAASVSVNGTTQLEAFRLVRPRGSLAGSVQLDGEGIRSGTVSAQRGGFEARAATPDGTGAFGMAGLASGSWTLEFTPGTAHELVPGESGTRSVTIAEDETASVSPFRIRARQPQSGVVEIHLTAGAEFSPSSVTIQAGTTVRWINDTNTAHTITPQNTSQSGVWQRQETSSQGVVFEHRFDVSGQTYRYRCEPHSSNFESGMVGVITVT